MHWQCTKLDHFVHEHQLLGVDDSDVRVVTGVLQDCWSFGTANEPMPLSRF